MHTGCQTLQEGSIYAAVSFLYFYVQLLVRPSLFTGCAGGAGAALITRGPHAFILLHSPRRSSLSQFISLRGGGAWRWYAYFRASRCFLVWFIPRHSRLLEFLRCAGEGGWALDGSRLLRMGRVLLFFGGWGRTGAAGLARGGWLATPPSFYAGRSDRLQAMLSLTLSRSPRPQQPLSSHAARGRGESALLPGPACLFPDVGLAPTADGASAQVALLWLPLHCSGLITGQALSCGQCGWAPLGSLFSFRHSAATAGTVAGRSPSPLYSATPGLTSQPDAAGTTIRGGLLLDSFFPQGSSHALWQLSTSGASAQGGGTVNAGTTGSGWAPEHLSSPRGSSHTPRVIGRVRRRVTGGALPRASSLSPFQSKCWAAAACMSRPPLVANVKVGCGPQAHMCT